MLRAPLPTTLNYYLAIHSNDSFWTVQKDQASLSAVLPTTPRRPVQTGRLPCSDTKRRHDGGQAGAVPPTVSSIFRRGSLCPVRSRAILEQRDGAAAPGVRQALRGLRCHRLFGGVDRATSAARV